MVQRPLELKAFEFAVLAGLRAAQLARGCTPRVTCGANVGVTAQIEVATGKIVRVPPGAGPNAERGPNWSPDELPAALALGSGPNAAPDADRLSPHAP